MEENEWIKQAEKDFDTAKYNLNGGEKEYLKKGLKNFFKKLSKDFRVSNFILFGSRATNDFNEDSDVDLIIVSEDFERMDYFERVSKMYDYWDLDLPVDFLCYTPEEFDKLKKKISIVKMALSEGVVLK